MFNVVIACFHI